MARDTDAERRDNLNRGLPKHSGLDDGTKASLQRSLDAGTTSGIKVGSFRDLQVGDTDRPVEDRPVNPNQSDDDLVTAAELDPQTDTGAKSKKSKK